MNKLLANSSFSASEIKTFEPILKVALLGTVNPQGLPHITMMASLQAVSPTTMTWGQFTEGMSFKNVLENPKMGFLIMTLQKDLWRGKATFTHTAKAGAEYEMYNNTPMFRYNAYFGIHTVYYADLLGHTGKGPLPMNPIVTASIKTLLAGKFAGEKSARPVLNRWTRALLDKIGNLKFLSYVQPDGYPLMIPLIQAMTPDSEHILFSSSVYSDELKAIPVGSPVAFFGLSLNMTDVLTRGTFLGFQRSAGFECGKMQVDWVYNPMPPKPQQIYPQLKLEAVRDFGE